MKTMTTTCYVFGTVIFAVALVSTPVFAATTTPLTKLQDKINAEEGRLAGFKVQIYPMLGISHTLNRKSTGNDVKLLQEFLRVYGVYPEGIISGYFGVFTEKAVKKFQEKESIDPVGVVGPKTRARVLEISQQKTSGFTASSTPEIIAAVLSDHITEDGSTMVPSTSFASTTENIYATLSFKDAMQDTQVSYARFHEESYIDSEVSHPSRSGLKYFHFQWSLKPGKHRTVGNYTMVLYVNGKRSKTIPYSIY